MNLRDYIEEGLGFFGRRKVRKLLRSGKKVSAIKEVRKRFQFDGSSYIGLKEAKDYVDNIDA